MFIELAGRKDFVEFVSSLAADNTSGIEAVEVHPDLTVVQSGQQNGNTDPRFGNPKDVILARSRLMEFTGATSLVTILPRTRDEYKDLTEPFTASKDDYGIWPEDIRPKEDVHYDPESPPWMVDLPFDGLITNRPGVALALNSADCAPLVMYDPFPGILGLGHVGREGAVQDMAP